MSAERTPAGAERARAGAGRDADPAAARALRRLAVLVIAIGFVFNLLGRGMSETWAVFLLPIENEFGWRRQDVTSVYSVYLMVNGLMAPFAGMLFDRFGPRASYGLGTALFGLAALGAAHAQAQWHFFVLSGLAFGISSAVIGMVPASVLIARWFAAGLGRAISFAYAGFGTGILVLVPIAQWSIERFGWRSTYLGFGSAMLLLCAGAMLLPWRRLAAGAPEVMAARGDARPVSRFGGVLAALRTREFWMLAQAFHFTALGMYLVIPQTVAYLIDNGFAPLSAASIFGVAGMLSMVGIVTSGWLSDRVGYRFAATLSFVLTLAGTACLAAISFSSLVLFPIGFVLLFGVAQGARGPIISTLSNRFFAGASAATVFGILYLAMSIGAALGSWGSGLLHDLTGGYLAAYAGSIVAIALAGLPFWFSRRLEWRAVASPQARGPNESTSAAISGTMPDASKGL